MAQTRPTIGICAGIELAQWGAWHREAVLLPLEYLREIQRAGGLAIMIPPDPQLIENPDEMLEQLDGLVLAGGRDVDPSAYGAERHPLTDPGSLERDRTEVALTRRAVERDMPVFGICRGMQVLNVSLGGTLNQHIPDDVGHEEHRRNLGTFEGNAHAVALTPGSLAARAAGEEDHSTLSHHHQAVATVGDGLEVTGVSTLDQLPEAIEAPHQRFVLGVQWHPEADERSLLIRAFVSEARAYRSARGSE